MSAPPALRIQARELGRIVGAAPGPTVIAIAGMHGNEPAGVHAVRRVLERFATGGIALCGELLMLAGNVAALQRGVRYQVKDLNRVWSDEHIAAVRSLSDDACDAEDREQRDLLLAIEAAVARSRGPMYIADCHTSSAAGVPFMIFGDAEVPQRIARAFPIPILLGLADHVAGVLTQHFAKRGFVTFSVEGGGHVDPLSIDAIEAVIWQTLDLTEQVTGAPELAEATALLERRRSGLPRVIEITSRRAITLADRFVMEPGFRNIDNVKAGQLLARDARGEIRAERDGIVVMPLYQGLGSDGFFWGQERRDSEP